MTEDTKLKGLTYEQKPFSLVELRKTLSVMYSRSTCSTCSYNHYLAFDYRVRLDLYYQGLGQKIPTAPEYELCPVNHERAYLTLLK